MSMQKHLYMGMVLGEGQVHDGVAGKVAGKLEGRGGRTCFEW